jgi:hypothetical protein
VDVVAGSSKRDRQRRVSRGRAIASDERSRLLECGGRLKPGAFRTELNDVSVGHLDIRLQHPAVRAAPASTRDFVHDDILALCQI